MRIIGGMAGGIRLQAPEGVSVRPTEDRVKESMFGTIGDLRGKVVVDMFSGTGALGLEALSRGAASVFFFEREKRHVAFIERNLAAVQKSMGGAAGGTRIICNDARLAPDMLPEVHPDLILADPPYAAGVKEYGAAGLVLDGRLAAWAGQGCLLVLEHAENNALPWDEQGHWRLLRTRTYGIRAVSFAIGGEVK
jgi:16S rRNA (guanine966-N2)-methyltransferase